MSGHLIPSRREVRETVQELRRHLGLFSFRNDMPQAESVSRNCISPELGVRPGGIVEWLVASRGAGAFTSAMQIMAQSSAGPGVLAIVDPAREFYVSALSGWGVDPAKVLLLRPATQAGNMLGDRGMPALSWCVGYLGVGRRANSCPGSSPLATGSGSRRRSGSVFSGRSQRRREPVWAELRLLVTPLAGGTRGGNQTTEYRGSVSPGRQGRHRPGVGDRPCRGSCASGSPAGQFSDCEAQGPSLTAQSSCCLPARSSGL